MGDLWNCHYCGREYHIEDGLNGVCPSDDCPGISNHEQIISNMVKMVEDCLPEYYKGDEPGEVYAEVVRRLAASLNKEHIIKVHLEGGLIQDVSGIPPGYCVVVRDYDLSDYMTDDEEDALMSDEQGRKYHLTEY